MIRDRELERRAADLGIPVRHAELDYVLNHILAQLAAAPNGFLFRGGTALARVYWPDFRISEDLDFISSEQAKDLPRLLATATARAAQDTGLKLTLAEGLWRDDRSRSLVRWDSPQSGPRELLIDVVRHEAATLPVRHLPLVLLYSDLREKEQTIPVMDVVEIMANKWLMLDDRDEPRDLFDLWWGLTREDVAFDDVATAHHARYGYKPMPISLKRFAQLETRWHERLEHQIRNPPRFDEVRTAVRESFDSWNAGSLKKAERPPSEGRKT